MPTVSTTNTTAIQYSAGSYTSDMILDVVKTMSFKSNKNADGKVTKVYGDWMNNSNIYKFRPGETTVLTKEDVSDENIKNLIKTGKIRRVL
jgi:hypothetical protein